MRPFAMATVLATAVIVSGALAAGETESKEKPMPTTSSPKKAILLVAFGTSYADAAAAYANIERLAKKRLPDYEIRWAYTSKMIRRKLTQEGRGVNSPDLALAKLADEGFTEVRVQSLHIIPGIEFDEVVATVAKWAQSPSPFTTITLGAPIINSMDDLRRSLKAVLAAAAETRKSGDALVLMGHGSGRHVAALLSVSAAHELAKLDPLAFVGTVEGNPTFEEVMGFCKKSGAKRVCIIPFMAVAGDHAKNDLAGNEPDSWKSLLTQGGFEAIPILKGMAANDDFASIWIDHLEASIKENPKSH